MNEIEIKMESDGTFFVVTVTTQEGLTIEYDLPPETEHFEDDVILEMIMPKVLEDLRG
tara:strand:- start:185 stop:358 length:174 start_codon:yes stop_codon:yes gene_type:complete